MLQYSPTKNNRVNKSFSKLKQDKEHVYSPKISPLLKDPVMQSSLGGSNLLMTGLSFSGIGYGWKGYTTEYSVGSYDTQWGTHIASFKFPNCP